MLNALGAAIALSLCTTFVVRDTAIVGRILECADGGVSDSL